MSAKASFWAWSQTGIGATAKLVLLCLADCHNTDTGRCDPGAKFIAEKSELNIKTVPAALQKLESSGLITIEKRPGKTPNYRLNIPQNWGNPKSGRGSTRNRGRGYPKIG